MHFAGSSPYGDSGHTSALAGYLLPFNNVKSLRATGWVSEVRCNGEGVPLHIEESNLIGTRPNFVPGNIDVMDVPAGRCRVRARIRENRVVERHSFIIRRSRAGRHHSTICGSDRVHATIG